MSLAHSGVAHQHISKVFPGYVSVRSIIQTTKFVKECYLGSKPTIDSILEQTSSSEVDLKGGHYSDVAMVYIQTFHILTVSPVSSQDLHVGI